MKKTVFFFTHLLYVLTSISSNMHISQTSNSKTTNCINSSQQLTHDQRLVVAVHDWYNDSLTSFKPSGLQITACLQETTKSLSIPLHTYHNLLTKTDTAFKTLKMFPSNPDAKKATNFCNYLQEQYTTNRATAISCRYTTILVLTRLQIPLDICKKIAASIEPIVFKIDILVMLRAASYGAPEKLDPDLYALYQRICPS